MSISFPYEALLAAAASSEDMDEREVEEAEARGESKGDAAAVGGHESDSVVVEVIVLLRAGLPLVGTAVEAILCGREVECLDGEVNARI